MSIKRFIGGVDPPHFIGLIATGMKWACGRLIRRAAMFFDKLEPTNGAKARQPPSTVSHVAKYRIEMTQPRTKVSTKSPVLSFQLHGLLRAKVALESRSHLPAPQMLRVLKLYYKVASSHLPAPQVAPRTKVALQSRQFSSSSSPDAPRTEVVLQSRQFSSSSSPDTPRAKVVLQGRQFSASSSPDTPRTKVVLQSRQFSSSSSPDTPRTKVVLQSRQFSASSSTDCSAY